MIGTAAKEALLNMIRNTKNTIAGVLRSVPKIVSYVAIILFNAVH